MRRSQQEQNLFTKVASLRWEIVSAPGSVWRQALAARTIAPRPGLTQFRSPSLLPARYADHMRSRPGEAGTNVRASALPGEPGMSATRPAPSGQLGSPPNPVRGCPCGGPGGSPRPRTHIGQRRHRGTDPAAFMQVNSYTAWHGGAVCKTVGSAYVGSNPTPATTCENGPLAGKSRLCGPFLLCPVMCHLVALRAAVSRCPRTYSGRRRCP